MMIETAVEDALIQLSVTIVDDEHGRAAIRNADEVLQLVERERIRLRAEVERLRQALAFYADGANYNADGAPSNQATGSGAAYDLGQRARDALDEGRQAR